MRAAQAKRKRAKPENDQTRVRCDIAGREEETQTTSYDSE